MAFSVGRTQTVRSGRHFPRVQLLSRAGTSGAVRRAGPGRTVPGGGAGRPHPRGQRLLRGGGLDGGGGSLPTRAFRTWRRHMTSFSVGLSCQFYVSQLTVIILLVLEFLFLFSPFASCECFFDYLPPDPMNTRCSHTFVQCTPVRNTIFVVHWTQGAQAFPFSFLPEVFF